MTQVSHIEDIVDASAAVARTITGVSRAFGLGNGLVVNPIDGGFIVPPQAAPPDAFTHVSELPRVAPIVHKSANVTELRWTIPMFLYAGIADYPTAIRILAPFAARYLGMFSQNMQLLGTCNAAEIQSVTFGGGPEDSKSQSIYLAISLQVYERLDLANLPGENRYHLI